MTRQRAATASDETKKRALPLEAKTSKDDCSRQGLTFDMSGGPKGAKRPLGRPLDGGVRRH